MTQWANHFENKFEGIKTVVTGGAGFIGSHITDALLRLGSHVTVVDDMSGGLQSNVDFLKGQTNGKNFTFIQGSILDKAVLKHALAGSKFVFHQAALGSVPRSMEEPQLYLNTNIQGTLYLLQAAKAADVKRVMFAASSSAYGDSPTLPKYEGMPVSPLSPYAVSKVAGEGLMRTFAASYGLDTASLRYFNIFGPRQNANSAYAAVIAAFHKALSNNQTPAIYGDGEQSRDFTYVDNVVYANLLSALNEKPILGQVLNVACGKRITVNQLAQIMIDRYGKSGSKPNHLPVRAGDVPHSLADLTLSAKAIGYQPLVSFDEGIEKTIDWYLNHSSK